LLRGAFQEPDDVRECSFSDLRSVSIWNVDKYRKILDRNKEKVKHLVWYKSAMKIIYQLNNVPESVYARKETEEQQMTVPRGQADSAAKENPSSRSEGRRCD